jgi:omega-6 fatty acid desaturase (delta-12 desaturase)
MARPWGWPTALAALYAALGHAWCVLQLGQHTGGALWQAGVVLLLSHSRVVAAILVHDATHEAVARRGWRNTVAGTALLWAAGTPYCYFPHVQRVHVAHHRDRADTVEFDYRAFVGRVWGLRHAVLALEWCFVPATELLMHGRTALSPLLWPDSKMHRANSAVGLLAMARLYGALYSTSGPLAVLLYTLSTCVLIHVLSYHDCFAHTYTVVDPQQQGYKPGPGDRSAAYEEANTYSTVLSATWPRLNVLTLNFGASAPM